MMELSNIKNVVTDSELVEHKEVTRKFTYKLNEKATRNKLIKGARRIPFDVVENSSSINLLFNLGSWSEIVMPSILYWEKVKETKTCRIGDKVVKIIDVKAGKEVTRSHVDTQISFLMNNDKIMLHCYNTTQLILVNGHGYDQLVQVFFKPYFVVLLNK